jgi:hypothetical protein
MGPALRGAATTSARSTNAPQYGARGAGIASQKFVEAANKLNAKPAKKTTGGAAYPKAKETI